MGPEKCIHLETVNREGAFPQSANAVFSGETKRSVATFDSITRYIKVSQLVGQIMINVKCLSVFKLFVAFIKLIQNVMQDFHHLIFEVVYE